MTPGERLGLSAAEAAAAADGFIDWHCRQRPERVGFVNSADIYMRATAHPVDPQFSWSRVREGGFPRRRAESRTSTHRRGCMNDWRPILIIISSGRRVDPPRDNRELLAHRPQVPGNLTFINRMSAMHPLRLPRNSPSPFVPTYKDSLCGVSFCGKSSVCNASAERLLS